MRTLGVVAAWWVNNRHARRVLAEDAGEPIGLSLLRANKASGSSTWK